MEADINEGNFLEYVRDHDRYITEERRGRAWRRNVLTGIGIACLASSVGSFLILAGPWVAHHFGWH